MADIWENIFGRGLQTGWKNFWRPIGDTINNAGKAVGEFMAPTPPGTPDLDAKAREQAQLGQQNVNAQTAANRPNQVNAFGSSSNWTQGPDGQWTQSQGFGGPLAGLSGALANQANASMWQPLSFSGLSPMQTGEGARDQAITGAYNQATSRLDPMFGQREEALRSQLVNQGLDPTSQAFQAEMANFGRDRNDAYGSAMNSAIAQGTSAGNSIFQNSLAGRQQGMGEMMTQRGQAMNDLLGMRGLLDQSGFNSAGLAQSPDLLAAAMGQGSFDMDKWKAITGRNADWVTGGANFLGSLLPIPGLKK